MTIEIVVAAGLWALCFQAQRHRDEGAAGAWGFCALQATAYVVVDTVLGWLA